MSDIYQVLGKLKITYETYEHPAVFTVEESRQYDRGINAGKIKNLFLRNRKGNRYYLVILESTKRADLAKLADMLGEDKLSFASPERLKEVLSLTPGSVSPFGIINDREKAVHMLIDKELCTYEKIAVHPNINTATLVVKTEDFKRFLQWTGNKVDYVTL